MTADEKRARDARYKREQRAPEGLGQIAHPARAPEATLPPLGDLFDLITQASRAAERRGLRLLFSLASGAGK